MTGRRKLTLWVLSIFIVAGAVALYLFLTKQPAPLNETSVAREALSKAKASKANVYEKESFAKAECLYDSAMNCWKRENRKPFYKRRDYTKVKTFAALSAQESEKAASAALQKVNNFQVNLKNKLETARKMYTKYNSIFGDIPLPDKVRNENNRGQLLLNEAELAYKNEQFVACNQKAEEAEVLLDRSYQYLKIHLQEYFGNYSAWKRQAEETIGQSRANRTNAVLVDKFARKCYLYQAGNLKHQFTVELGPNWIGDKICKGDKRTPEGKYKVTAIKSGKHTKYYKALLLDYPNAEDQARFNQNRKSLPRHARIGNLIEVHGGGGKQGDWTDGCVALENSDMDILFRYSSVNMPVTIVGSLRPLSEILN
ncbi:MAG: L,D-transpeptidase family protein [Prolixibacteraceae bacterium]|jgi:hypothetical protein|nr:L,D-transpeptidase family protein [Prolixibacteraceae bacterium]